MDSTIRESSKFRHQAWPLPEPLVDDEAFFPSDYSFDSMAKACTPLPDCLYPTAASWGQPQLGFNSWLDREISSLFVEAGNIPRSPTSPSSDERDENPWEGKSSPDSGFKPSSRFNTRPSKWVKTKKARVSKAAAHNLIEKKYRSNLNEKMMALRDTIPSLRTVVEKGTDDTDSQEPGRRLNKVSVHKGIPLPVGY